MITMTMEGNVKDEVDDDDDEKCVDPYAREGMMTLTMIRMKWIMMMTMVLTRMPGRVQEAKVAFHLCKSQSQFAQARAPDICYIPDCNHAEIMASLL